MRRPLKLCLLWCIAAALSECAHTPMRSVVPCSTDWDCCERNPRICAEVMPELYRAVWGAQ